MQATSEQQAEDHIDLIDDAVRSTIEDESMKAKLRNKRKRSFVLCFRREKESKDFFAIRGHQLSQSPVEA